MVFQLIVITVTAGSETLSRQAERERGVHRVSESGCGLSADQAGRDREEFIIVGDQSLPADCDHDCK